MPSPYFAHQKLHCPCARVRPISGECSPEFYPRWTSFFSHEGEPQEGAYIPLIMSDYNNCEG